jgi:hypothetical protein
MFSFFCANNIITIKNNKMMYIFIIIYTNKKITTKFYIMQNILCKYSATNNKINNIIPNVRL